MADYVILLLLGAQITPRSVKAALRAGLDVAGHLAAQGLVPRKLHVDGRVGVELHRVRPGVALLLALLLQVPEQLREVLAQLCEARPLQMHR